MSRFRVAAFMLAIGVLAACGSDDGTGTTPPSEPADSSSTSAANPTVVFDGSTCTYEGPTQVIVGGLTPVALVNASDIDIDAGLFAVRSENALTAAFDRLPPGSGSDILLAPPPDSTQEAWLQAGPGTRNEESLLLEPGLYLMDCARIPAGASVPDYVWRGGSFEGVAE